MIKNAININVAKALLFKVGKVNNDDLKMLNIYSNAWVSELALKKIQAKAVNVNVRIILINSLNDGNILSCATISKLFLFVLKIIEGKMNNAFRNPQNIKVQFAPCQNPLIINIINVFHILIQLPPLLPPKGIYK